MDSLASHQNYLVGEWQSLQATPLSARKAMLVAALADAYVDRMFAAEVDAEDILAFRAKVAAQSPALGQIMALCTGRATLVTQAVAVPLADYGKLAVEDFMVSLYNNHSVQRLRLVMPDEQSCDMLETLAAAMAELDLG